MVNFPDKSINLDFQDEIFKITFPKTGQLMKIFTLRSKLLDGQANNMINDSIDSYYIVLLAEMEAHFTHVMPKEFWDKLLVKSISELDAIHSAELVKLYLSVYLPWFRKWLDILQKDDILEENEEKPVNKDIPRIE